MSKKVTKKVTKKKVIKKANKKAPAKKTGRPSKFDEKLIPVIRNLIKRGMIIEDICDVMNISEKTYYNWKNDYPEFFQPEKDWKKQADKEIEIALKQRALGYTSLETKVFCTKDGSIKTHNMVKQYPPDVTAQKFWLTNRKGEEWAEKPDVEVNVNNDFNLAYKLGDSKKKK